MALLLLLDWLAKEGSPETLPRAGLVEVALTLLLLLDWLVPAVRTAFLCEMWLRLGILLLELMLVFTEGEGDDSPAAALLLLEPGLAGLQLVTW